jgi:hypothetical protein
MVKKNDLGNAFVPIDRVPSASQKQIVNLARSYGAIPAGVSDADALRQYRDRIERAYAMALSRAPDESIRNVLTGKR